MKPLSFKLSASLLITSGLAVGVGLTAINHQPALGMAVVAAIEGGRRWRQKRLTSDQLWRDSSYWLVGLASVIIIALNPNRFSQVGLAILYGLVRWWLDRSSIGVMTAAAVVQGAVLWATFLAEGVWHWPTLVVLVVTWVSSWLVASNVVSGNNDRAANVLALTWALIVAECSWIFSLWLVNYIIFNGLLIVPQPALVITALGYCLAGIYISHRRSQLSRTRLVEYLMIGLVILVIVITGTKWNGAI